MRLRENQSVCKYALHSVTVTMRVMYSDANIKEGLQIYWRNKVGILIDEQPHNGSYILFRRVCKIAKSDC